MAPPDLVTPGFDDRTLRTPLLVQQTDIPVARAGADRESAAHLRQVWARLGS